MCNINMLDNRSSPQQSIVALPLDFVPLKMAINNDVRQYFVTIQLVPDLSSYNLRVVIITLDSVLLKRRRRGRLRRRPYFYRIDIHLRIPYPDHCARITVHPKLNVTQEERKHQIVLTKQRPRDDGSVHIYPKEILSGIESNWTGARGLFAEENCCRPGPSHREIFRHTQRAWNHTIIFNSDFRISAL